MNNKELYIELLRLQKNIRINCAELMKIFKNNFEEDEPANFTTVIDLHLARYARYKAITVNELYEKWGEACINKSKRLIGLRKSLITLLSEIKSNMDEAIEILKPLYDFLDSTKWANYQIEIKKVLQNFKLKFDMLSALVEFIERLGDEIGQKGEEFKDNLLRNKKVEFNTIDYQLLKGFSAQMQQLGRDGHSSSRKMYEISKDLNSLTKIIRKRVFT